MVGGREVKHGKCREYRSEAGLDEKPSSPALRIKRKVIPIGVAFFA